MTRWPSGSAAACSATCRASSTRVAQEDVPPWAIVIGGALLIAMLGFAVIGSAVVFTWLTRALA